MAKTYQIYGFSYINDENGMNTLNQSKGATWDEVYEEYNVACFNGVAYFASCGDWEDAPTHYYMLTYPKINELTAEMKEKIEFNNGYVPEAGEYGCICSTFGVVKEITEKQFKEVMRDYPIKKSDYISFPWLNGGYTIPYFNGVRKG